MTAAATAEPRTLAPPERVATVVGNEVLGAYRLIAAEDLDGPAGLGPASSTCSRRRSGWGGGADERPYLPRAFVRAPGPESAGVRLEFRSRTSAPARSASPPSEAGEGLALGWARSGSARARGAGHAAAPRGRRHRHRPAAVPVGGAGGATCAARVPLRPRPRGGRAPLLDLGLATDDGSAGRWRSSRSSWARSLERPCHGLRPRPAADARGGPAMCAEREVPAQLAL